MSADDELYLAQRVQDAIARDAAELGVEVTWRRARLVVRGQVVAANCPTVLAIARAAAGEVEVVDELDPLSAAHHDDALAERIEP